MARQFLRAWKLSAGGVTCGGDLRVVFSIRWGVANYQPIAAQIRVYNLAPNTANSILAAKSVTFQAGYPDNIGTIFSGDVKLVNLGKENATDTTTTVYAAAGDVAHNTAVANQTFKAGAPAG